MNVAFWLVSVAPVAGEIILAGDGVVTVKPTIETLVTDPLVALMVIGYVPIGELAPAPG